jgi:hypothetical protein
MHDTGQRPPYVVMRVNEVTVQSGETITVWLGNIDDENGRTQVELRVLPDGKKEVFVDPGTDVMDIDEWYNPNDDSL